MMKTPQTPKPLPSISDTKGALIKTGRGRLFVALESKPSRPVVCLVYHTGQDFLLLMLDNDEAIEIARDLDADFSNRISQQSDITLMTACGGNHRQRVPVVVR